MANISRTIDVMKWHYLDNLMPTRGYCRSKNSLSPEASRIVSDLNRDGLSVSSHDRLFGNGGLYQELLSAVKILEARNRERIASVRAHAGETADNKTFLIELLGKKPLLDLENIFVRFALQKPMIQIANAYFGMLTQLRFYNVWHSFATPNPPLRSQYWHRDRDDFRVLKIFLYLVNVDSGTGPFTYALGTHSKGRIQDEAPSFLEEGRKNPRSTDDQMRALVPEKKWLECTGPERTLIFADTTGYHKGGLARTRDRILFNCMFVSQAAKCDIFFERRQSLPENLDHEIRFALSA